MGGKSTGTFTMSNGVGIFDGEVVDVPFLKAPGFIKVATTDRASWPDVSGCKALALTAKTPSNYTGYRVSFGMAHPPGGKFFAYGYKAHFDAPVGDDFSKVVIPFDMFTDLWDDSTGDPVKTCAEDSRYCPDKAALKDLKTVSIWAEGVAGKVHLEIKSIAATQCDGQGEQEQQQQQQQQQQQLEQQASKVAKVQEAGRKTLATFDGASGTTFDWEAVNDPVMGGQSESTFTVDKANAKAVWDGEVKIVPFLHAPGFCTARTKGTQSFPDISGLDGIEIAVTSKQSAVTNFQVQISTKGGRTIFKQGTYSANFTVPATTATTATAAATAAATPVFVPWSAFELTWRGEKISGPAITSQLDKIYQVGLGTAFPGKAGKFHLEVTSIASTKAPAATAAIVSDSSIKQDLVAFDGASKATTFKWNDMNDPVMGGLSTSSFTVDADKKAGVFNGTVRIVPKLKAPGFCNAETSNGLGIFSKFNDVSNFTHLMIRCRTTTPSYAGFKVSFAADTINPLFHSFKASFNVAAGADWQTIAVPFASFSNDWSSFTGDCSTTDPDGKTHKCCSKEHPEVCPTAHNLGHITQVGLWAEGHAGDFHLEVDRIGAGTPEDKQEQKQQQQQENEAAAVGGVLIQGKYCVADSDCEGTSYCMNWAGKQSYDVWLCHGSTAKNDYCVADADCTGTNSYCMKDPSKSPTKAFLCHGK